MFLVVQTDEQLLEVLQGPQNTKLNAFMPKTLRVKLVRLLSSEIPAIPAARRKFPSRRELSPAPALEVTELASEPVTPTEQASSFAAMEVTEPAALKPLSLKEQNSQNEPIEVNDYNPEPVSPKEPNPSVKLTAMEAATSLKRSQPPNQGESSCTVAANGVAVLSEPSPRLSFQKPTSAAEESPEPQPSSMAQNLPREPCSCHSRKIQEVTKSREYDYNLGF